MADFSSMAQSVGGLRMEVTKSLKDANIQIRSFGSQDRASALPDIMGQLDRLSKSAVAAPATGGLMLGAFDLDFGGLAAGLGHDGPEAALLREAKQLIAKEQFREARRVLAKILEMSEGHHEATYLLAYCHHKSDDQIQALTVLFPLREANLSNRLTTRVQMLRGEIRAKLLPLVTTRYMAHMRASNPAKAIEALAKVAELDPAVGKYHFFLASALVIAGRHGDALRALIQGLDLAESDHDELVKLKNQIEVGYVAQKLQPARKLYIEGKYAAARQAIEQLDADCKQSELCRSFDKFLESKAASAGGLFTWFAGKKPAAPRGLSGEQLEKVHAFLVRDELLQAKKSVDTGQLQNAENWLALAVRYAPEYPLANYLYAVRIYERVGAATKSENAQAGKVKGIDELLGQLGAAKNHARIGASDSQNNEARALNDAIDQLTSELRKVRQDIEDQEHDAKYVNRYVDDFIQLIVRLVEPGMNAQRALDIVNRLRSLRDGASSSKRSLKTPQGLQIMEALEGFARQILSAIGQ